MPKPVDSGQRYMPGLDGLRALAVLAVIAYHEQFGWAQGGLLGVGVFFTLSGFLITSLLLEQWSAKGQIKLGEFWLRRARRLLPALFVMLAVVTAWVTIADRSRLGSLRGAVGAAAGYFSNWYLIAKNQSYFSRFAPPAPLDHLWSLAVEEQFYLLWPLLLMGGLLLLRHRGKAAPRWLILPTLLLTGLSIFELAHLYQPGLDPTRVYEGTDTRAFGLLIGAVLALAWPTQASRGAAPPRRGGGGGGGAGGAAGGQDRTRRGGLHWPGRDRRDDLASRRVLPVRLPGRTCAALGGNRGCAGRHRVPGDAGGPGAWLAAAALDWRPVLWHLPVALSGHRADHAGQHQTGPAQGNAADR